MAASHHEWWCPHAPLTGTDRSAKHKFESSGGGAGEAEPGKVATYRIRAVVNGVESEPSAPFTVETPAWIWETIGSYTLYAVPESVLGLGRSVAVDSSLLDDRMPNGIDVSKKDYWHNRLADQDPGGWAQIYSPNKPSTGGISLIDQGAAFDGHQVLQFGFEENDDVLYNGAGADLVLFNFEWSTDTYWLSLDDQDVFNQPFAGPNELQVGPTPSTVTDSDGTLIPPDPSTNPWVVVDSDYVGYTEHPMAHTASGQNDPCEPGTDFNACGRIVAAEVDLSDLGVPVGGIVEDIYLRGSFSSDLFGIGMIGKPAEYRVDLRIAGVSDQDEDGTGGDPAAFVAVNDNRDEDNRDSSGNPLLDNAADSSNGHRVVGPSDEQLLPVTLELLSNTTIDGSYKLNFANDIRVWREDGSSYVEVVSDQEMSGLDSSVNLLVEGMSPNDVVLTAMFSPDFAATDYVAHTESDSVSLRVGDIDLAIDNLSQVWEEDPGAVIFRNSDFSKKLTDPFGQPEPGFNLYLPDYWPSDLDTAEHELLDGQYQDDLTAASLTMSSWVKDHFDLRFTFDENIIVWDLTGWTQPAGEGPFMLDPAQRQIRSGEVFTPSTDTLDLWIEGIDNSTQFSMDSIVVEAVLRDSSPVNATSSFKDQVDYTVVEVNAGVDGNRDTEIDFASNHDQTLTFWFNNDQETTVNVQGVDYLTEEVDITAPDADDNTIVNSRDLEDFAPYRVFVDPILVQNAFDLSKLGGGNNPALGELRVEYTIELDQPAIAGLENPADTSLNLFRSSQLRRQCDSASDG